jgi:glycosyltransferase 2 family protein
MIVGAISMLPGGLGSTEATMVLLLTALNVPLDSALAATAIVRVTTFWFAVAIGVACMPFALQWVQRASLGMRIRREVRAP